MLKKQLKIKIISKKHQRMLNEFAQRCDIVRRLPIRCVCILVIGEKEPHDISTAEIYYMNKEMR